MKDIKPLRIIAGIVSIAYGMYCLLTRFRAYRFTALSDPWFLIGALCNSLYILMGAGLLLRSRIITGCGAIIQAALEMIIMVRDFNLYDMGRAYAVTNIMFAAAFAIIAVRCFAKKDRLIFCILPPAIVGTAYGIVLARDIIWFGYKYFSYRDLFGQFIIVAVVGLIAFGVPRPEEREQKNAPECTRGMDP
ncbi:MAG: hypothetical protein CW338_09215 [Clostridiales bacterium]|nr:hypothetical protein [Clostridiales bacterium]